MTNGAHKQQPAAGSGALGGGGWCGVGAGRAHGLWIVISMVQFPFFSQKTL